MELGKIWRGVFRNSSCTALPTVLQGQNRSARRLLSYQNIVRHLLREDDVEYVTCYVECLIVSSCTAMYAGISSEMNHVLGDCYVKVRSLRLRIKRFLAWLKLVTMTRLGRLGQLIDARCPKYLYFPDFNTINCYNDINDVSFCFSISSRCNIARDSTLPAKVKCRDEWHSACRLCSLIGSFHYLICLIKK